MTDKTIDIERDETVIIKHPTWGDITVNLDTYGAYIIKALPNCKFTVNEKRLGSKVQEFVIVRNNIRDANND